MTSVILIGGLDRLHGQYRRAAAERGVDLRCYTGREADLADRVGSATAVLVVTSVVSHRAVNIARSRVDTPIIRLRGAGVGHVRRGITLALQQLAALACLLLMLMAGDNATSKLPGPVRMTDGISQPFPAQCAAR